MNLHRVLATAMFDVVSGRFERVQDVLRHIAVPGPGSGIDGWLGNVEAHCHGLETGIALAPPSTARRWLCGVSVLEERMASTLGRLDGPLARRNARCRDRHELRSRRGALPA